MRSQKNKVQTGKFRKKCNAQSRAEEHHVSPEYFGAEQHFSFIGRGDAMRAVYQNRKNAPQKCIRETEPAINHPESENN